MILGKHSCHMHVVHDSESDLCLPVYREKCELIKFSIVRRAGMKWDGECNQKCITMISYRGRVVKLYL